MGRDARAARPLAARVTGRGRVRAWALCAAAALAIVPGVAGRSDVAGAGPIVPRAWLALDAVDGGGRRPFAPDAVFARHLLDPDAAPPAEGERVAGETGEAAWRAVQAAEDGTVAGPTAWAYARVEVERSGVWLAESSGARTVFVNGVPAVGDLYGLGYGAPPVELAAGVNHVFVRARGASGFRLRLVPPPAPLFVAVTDVTRPDLVAGPDDRTGRSPPPPTHEVGLLMVNASRMRLQGLTIVTGQGGHEATFGEVTTVHDVELPPLAMLKLPAPFALRDGLPHGETTLALPVAVSSGSPPLSCSAVVPLDVKPRAAPRRLVFRSWIDDSVQEFAVLAPSGPPGSRGTSLPSVGAQPEGAQPEADPDRTPEGAAVGWDAGAADREDRPGLVLTLHGAGVDALAQVASHSPRPDLWIVAPTNRRPYGFDWQDWGREDAYEVLVQARQYLDFDPHRINLTGHSMGGHGVWHLAVNDPFTFAAIGPSAGWASFDSYGGRPDGELAPIWQAADGASRTEAMLDALRGVPIHVVHGAADDNVPVGEAEALVAALRAAGHDDLTVHVEPGAGHWWDGDAAPGADCVDWPGLFELFERARNDRDAFTFIDADPADLPSPAYDIKVHVLQREVPSQPARIEVRLDREAATAILTTTNARHLYVSTWTDLVTRFVIDGDELPSDQAYRHRFEHRLNNPLYRRDGDGGHWVEDSWPEFWPMWGTKVFKHAFGSRFLLVVPTGGDEEENAASLARARHDAQAWWYRGNGRGEIVSDERLLAARAERTRPPDWLRNVILYGNRDTNRAWDLLVPESSPIDVRRDALRVGDRIWVGDDLGALAVRPKPRHSRTAPPSIVMGLAASTGPRGDRVGATLPLFVSGVGWPGYTAFSSRVLSQGDGGVLAAGWYDADWEPDGRGFLRDGAPEEARPAAPASEEPPTGAR